MIKRLLPMGLLILLLTSLALGAAAQDAAGESAVTLPWWNDRVFYEIFVRSFYDSNADSRGDLRGIIEKLDYLNDGDPTTTTDLGVTGLWLMPVMKSSSYHGYDVLDYREIDPDYGTLDDLRELIQAAHDRGIAVVVDMVFNHTARANQWFSESIQPDGPRADWYIWASENPGYRGPDLQQVWHSYAGRYYYGLFSDTMPDLNLTNPDVTGELHDIARYWLEDVGVDGFRLDAVRHYVEEGTNQENTPSTHAWTGALNAFVKDVAPESLLIGEVWSNTYEASDYVNEGELDLVFEFDLAQGMVDSAAMGDPAGALSLQQRAVDEYPPGQYGVFLTNHDQNRVMNQVRSNPGAARVAASTLLTSPGVPFIYYGEEIGMTGQKPDERIRTPMQWDATPVTAGFTAARRPWQALSAGNEDGVSVAAQTDDADSLLSHYRALIHLRSEHPALRQGDWLNLRASNRDVYAILRRSAEETLLVLINYSDETITDLTLSARAGALQAVSQAETIFGGVESSVPVVAADGSFEDYAPVESIAPYQTVIIRLS